MSRTEKSVEVESGLMIIMASEELNEEWLSIGVEWFIHVVAHISNSLLLFAYYNPIGWIYNDLFINLLGNGHLGYLQFWFIITIAAMNIHISCCMDIYLRICSICT